MYRLQCVAQQYDWGKLGAESAVAQLKAKGEAVAVDAAKPYAEYWFGTHPSGPSSIVVNDKVQLLQDWLLANPAALGAAPYNSISALPYLFKVLSIAKALSVQAHPDKALAERLHAARPDVYKDDNHKPELACALTPFEAMCGFRSPAEIAAHARTVPELRAMLGEEVADALAGAGEAAAAPGAPQQTVLAFKDTLRAAYTAFMNQPDALVQEHTGALEARLRTAEASGALAAAAAATAPGLLDPSIIALRLCRQFPRDVGVFSPYLLNTISLAPGDAIFLAANEPHAYLSGDCMEVMACSDNVVRAGLTPKFKDVATLCSMLTYTSGAPPVDRGVVVDAYTRQYNAPVPEFRLQRTEVPPSTSSAASGATSTAVALPPIPSAAIVVVVGGSGTASVTLADGSSSSLAISEGQVWLQAAGSSVTVTNSSADSSLLLFRSHANA